MQLLVCIWPKAKCRIKGRPTMPPILYINERFFCDATIILDSGDACWISVGSRGVIIRSHKNSFFGGLLGSVLGPKLYREKDPYRTFLIANALREKLPPVHQIQCKNLILRAFCTAGWHCSSPASVTTALIETVALEQ
ncbi:hypothetical protein [Bradyrhizobium symbiodeficiens]|uniref:hypothetical protein n=1 Tax=Bradyrhizobium symbiodeficiens TaxID=1404367 RepID=UPI00140F8015|nr:hypothetical protein [Bradyrhizobium symbiodeficiens]QIP01756.1 hypothetical protein HAU86_19035 [Bradyrhizobium symbiodeficiens]